MGDPKYHYHSRKNAKQNAKHPVIGFRCPSLDYKKRVKREAKKAGVSVQEYLLTAVSQYMANPAPASAPTHNVGLAPKSAPKSAKVDQELLDALDDLDFKI